MRNYAFGLLALAALMILSQPPCPCVDAQEKAEKPKAGQGGNKERIPAEPTADDVRTMLANITEVITDIEEKYAVRDREKALEALRAAASTGIQVRLSLIAQKGAEDPDRFIRIDTVRTLGAYGPLARYPFSSYFIGGLDDKDASVRYAVAETIVQIYIYLRLNSEDEDVRAMMPALRRMVKSEPDADARRAAVAALGALGPAAKRAVPELIELVEDEKAGELRAFALISLAQIGPGAKQAAPLFLELARKNDKKMGAIALTNLGKIAPGDKAALALVMERLKGTLDNPKLLTDNTAKPGHYGQRHLAVAALGSFGSAAEPAVPLLIGALEAKDVKDRMAAEEIRRQALMTLIKIGPGAQAALPVASKIARDPDESAPVRFQAKAFVDYLK